LYLIHVLRRAPVRGRTASVRAPNSGESPVPRRKALAPIRGVLAGADERTILPPPTSPRSSVDSFRIRAQLRLTFSHRMKSNYRKPNSGESPVPRRKAPPPIRFAFAGAGAGKGASAPIRVRSPEKSVLLICQLRQAFARRRRDYYRKPTSGEKPVHRRKAPAPIRVVLAGAGERPRLPPPMSVRSSEDSFRIRAQLRPTFSHRRRDYYRQSTSGEKPVPRRKAPAPIRVVLAGAGERTILPPPPSPCSSEDSLCIRAQLLQAFARRRTIITGSPTPVRSPFPGGKHQTKKRNRGSSDHSVLNIHIHFKLLYHPHPPALPVSFPARVSSLLSFP